MRIDNPTIQLTFAAACACALMLMSACSQKTSQPQSETNTIRIAAAGNLRFVLPRLKDKFESLNRGVNIETTFGASGSLFAQLDQGAPFDIFLSANNDYATKLASQMSLTDSACFQFTRGRIAIWKSGQSTADGSPTIQSLINELSESGSKVAIPNPRHAPFGQAAKQFLDQSELDLITSSRLAIGENAMQTAHFAQAGSVKFAILPMSCILGTQLETDGQFAEIPSEHYQPIDQTAVILKKEPKSTVEQFRQFLLSDAAQAIFVEHGYSRLDVP